MDLGSIAGALSAPVDMADAGQSENTNSALPISFGNREFGPQYPDLSSNIGRSLAKEIFTDRSALETTPEAGGESRLSVHDAKSGKVRKWR